MAEQREAEKEESEWETKVVGALESLKMVQVAEGWVSCFPVLKFG